MLGWTGVNFANQDFKCTITYNRVILPIPIKSLLPGVNCCKQSLTGLPSIVDAQSLQLTRLRFPYLGPNCGN